MLKKILLFSFFVMTSCSHTKKYEMPSMMGGEENIDITNLVIDNGFKPIYDDRKNICALINPSPLEINVSHEGKLKTEFKKWLSEKNPKIDTFEVDKILLSKNSKYQYTYLITYNPVDVYKIEIKIKESVIIAYFRVENDNLIFPFKEDGWIIPSPVR